MSEDHLPDLQSRFSSSKELLLSAHNHGFWELLRKGLTRCDHHSNPEVFVLHFGDTTHVTIPCSQLHDHGLWSGESELNYRVADVEMRGIRYEQLVALAQLSVKGTNAQRRRRDIAVGDVKAVLEDSKSDTCDYFTYT